MRAPPATESPAYHGEYMPHRSLDVSDEEARESDEGERLRGLEREVESRASRESVPRERAVRVPVQREHDPQDVADLQAAVERLQEAEEELRQQNLELESAREQLEYERQRYIELFEFAPDGYVVTDPAGV
ncbi:MAG TPA: hypothetical protein VJ596_02145, partial [Gemmatimonadaceae bacterium]|nr:hypothetical protein [Gemmatimonadaceae bacterium]